MLPFALTIFSGAFLLFQVQPLIGKFILPWFGGTPAVWTTCMLFFQVVLLGGYAYAYGLTKWLNPRKQVVVHIALLLGSLTTLPILPAESWKPGPEAQPTAHILLLLLATIGLPYFMLSTTGPLMQKWFSNIHAGRSPYRLYSLSNVGSMAALISFPFVFEPGLNRAQLANFWSLGLLVFVGSCAWCTWQLWQWSSTQPAQEDPLRAAAEAEPNPSLGRILLWLLLPAVASALLLATTNKLTLDVAVIPFLWVLPLCLYLLTFVVCFAEKDGYTRRTFLPLLIIGVFAICNAMKNIDELNMVWQVIAYCGGLFACCMVCHGELYHLRPGNRHLTGFYLMISLGGALGGFFVAVIAPRIFVSLVEMHWTLAATMLLAWIVCRPRPGAVGHQKWHTAAWYAALVLILAASQWLYQLGRHTEPGLIEAGRNFYGTLAVHEQETNPGPTRLLYHGRINHGIQVMDGEHQRAPTSYFGEHSGLGQTFEMLPRKEKRRVGVVGLGIGVIGAHANTGDVFRFYEINPEVTRMAREHFTYLKDCKAQVDVIIGDGRLSLEREEPQEYDLIILDAFSSDAVPVHLLTREAFEIYRGHLRSGGKIAVNVTNRYLDLRPVIRNAAAHLGYAATVVDTGGASRWTFVSRWVILSEDEAFVLALDAQNQNNAIRPSKRKVPLWTDDYSSLFGVLLN
jgi:spermidine synthase